MKSQFFGLSVELYKCYKVNYFDNASAQIYLLCDENLKYDFFINEKKNVLYLHVEE